MAVANLANTALHIKVQSGLGTPATGTGATGIEVLPSTGLGVQIATIQSQMIQRSRMSKRPRQGSKFIPTAYETELTVDNLLVPIEYTLGGTTANAMAFTNADWGDVTITGTGVTATFSAGTIVTDGVRAGMMARFTNLSVAGNNSVWVPILTAAEGVLTFPTGILADNATDAAWNIAIAKSIYTTTPYVDRYVTIEESLVDIDRSRLGTDMRANSLSFDAQPDAMVRMGFGFGGRDLDLLATGASPHFTDPVFTDNQSLTLLDGAVYINGTRRAGTITGISWGLSGPTTGIPVVDSKLSPDIMLGQFQFTGRMTTVLEDGADWDLFDAETQISAFIRCAEQGGTNAEDFISFYFGNLAYGNWSPGGIGGEGAAIQSMDLYGGEDERGTGYAPTTVLVSTSA